MKTKNCMKAKIILAVYLIATCALLLFGYSVQAPAVKQQEFPFTVTYSYQGKVETISDIYVAEYAKDAKYIGEDSLAWFGYVKDRNRLTPDFYNLMEQDGQALAINLNIEPGHLMGDPRYADAQYQPTGWYYDYDDGNEITITDPAQLEELGFRIENWDYPAPIENSFSFGGISLSSEATVYTSLLAVAALLACVILIRKDPEQKNGKLDVLGIVLNFLVVIVVLPFVFVVSSISEILGDVSFWQQLMYFSPALTAIGVAASVTLRRLGYKHISFWCQFVGPVIFALPLLAEMMR